MLHCRLDQGNINIAARKNGTFLLEGREENKETELLETPEMQRRGHRRWAHTHTPQQTGSIAHPKGQHLRSGQPCRDKAGGADTGSHLSTAGTDTALWSQMLPGAEPATSHRRSGGRWNWCFDELPPSAARSAAGSHPPAGPSRCWLPNQGVLFFG